MVESELAVQTSVCTALKDDNEALHKKLRNTEIKLGDQLQYSRRNCLLVHDIEETLKEKTNDKLIKMFSNSLQVDISSRDICRSHRISKKTEAGRQTHSIKKKIRPMIVKFVSYADRKNIFDSKHKLKGRNISITESLTTTDTLFIKNVWNNMAKIMSGLLMATYFVLRMMMFTS